MGVCNSYSDVEIRVNSVTLLFKVPNLKNIKKSSIFIRRKNMKINKGKNQSVQRVAFKERNF